MTIDDENSIYVGGLPYDATEDDLREAFELFGRVIAVKIINDKEVGGKCYGFVTFTNPRSAVDAISDMNGRTIGGRVVRVNEVRTRGGRPNFHRENFRRDSGRDIDWERDRDHIRDRDRIRDRNIERSRERERDRDYERGHEFDHVRDRDFDHARDHDFDSVRDHAFDQGRDRSLRDQEHARDHDRDLDRDRDLDWDLERKMDKTRDHDAAREKEHHPKKRSGAHLDDCPSRELAETSSDDDQHRVKEELEISISRREELQKELELIEGRIYEHEHHVSDLQKKSQKLEDALVAARKLTSQRQSMLAQLHRYFIQAQDYSERLKNYEQELKALVDTAIVEVDMGEETGTRDGSAYANGQS